MASKAKAMKIFRNFHKALQQFKTNLNSSNSNSSKSVPTRMSPSTANHWQMASKSMGLKPPFSLLIRSYPLAIWSNNRWLSKISSKSRRPVIVWNNFKFQESHPLYSRTFISNSSRIMETTGANNWSRRCKLLYLPANRHSSSNRCQEPLSSPRIWWSSTEAILWCNICAEIQLFYDEYVPATPKSRIQAIT